MLRSRPVSLALVGLFVWMTGCSTYTQIELNEVGDHGKVRVTLTDGERETLRDPRVEGDSIKAVVKEGDYRRPRSISVGKVVELEAVGTDEIGTVFTVIGVFVGVVVVAYAVSCAVTDTSDSFVDLCAY